MERIVILSIKVKMDVKKGIDIDDVINDLNYSVTCEGTDAVVTDTDMEDYEIRK